MAQASRSAKVPKVAPVTAKHRDLDEVLRDHAELIDGMRLPSQPGEERLSSVLVDVETTLSTAASSERIEHGLGRAPVGAVLVGMGGGTPVNDLHHVLSLDDVDASTALIYLRLSSMAGTTTRTLRFLLF